MAATVTCTLTVIILLLRPILAANWAAFNITGQVPLHRGQDVIFKCSGPVGHQIQLKEVGQPNTFAELDFLNRLPEYVNSLEYEPLQCNSDPPEGTTICSKVVNMTVTDYMHGKAYECRSLDTTQNTHVFSAEVRVEVRELLPTSAYMTVMPTTIMRSVTPSPATTSTKSSSTTQTTTPTFIETDSSAMCVHGLNFEITSLLMLALLILIFL